MKIMASGPTTSWEIDGETVETMSDFIFLGSKISADGDCSHEIKRCWLLGRKVMSNLDSIFKSRDITLPTKVCLVKVIVFPNIKMNPPQVYTCSPSWTLLPPPSPHHPSGSSQCTSPKHPVSCIESGLVTHFIYDIIHISMPFSQIIPPSPSPTESKRLFYTSVSLLLSRIQGCWCFL